VCVMTWELINLVKEILSYHTKIGPSSIYVTITVEAVLSYCSRNFEQSLCASEENSCVNCSSMKDYIHLLATELKSARLIIKLLQDDLKFKVTEPTTTINLPRRVNPIPQANNNSESGSVSESGWKTKLPMETSRCLKQLTPYIPFHNNSFAPLRDLQEE
jgi:hypothetical protein